MPSSAQELSSALTHRLRYATPLAVGVAQALPHRPRRIEDARHAGRVLAVATTNRCVLPRWGINSPIRDHGADPGQYTGTVGWTVREHYLAVTVPAAIEHRPDVLNAAPRRPGHVPALGRPRSPCTPRNAARPPRDRPPRNPRRPPPVLTRAPSTAASGPPATSAWRSSSPPAACSARSRPTRPARTAPRSAGYPQSPRSSSRTGLSVLWTMTPLPVVLFKYSR